jgi:hypothetical protein
MESKTRAHVHHDVAVAGVACLWGTEKTAKVGIKIQVGSEDKRPSRFFCSKRRNMNLVLWRNILGIRFDKEVRPRNCPNHSDFDDLRKKDARN